MILGLDIALYNLINDEIYYIASYFINCKSGNDLFSSYIQHFGVFIKFVKKKYKYDYNIKTISKTKHSTWVKIKLP